MNRRTFINKSALVGAVAPALALISPRPAGGAETADLTNAVESTGTTLTAAPPTAPTTAPVEAIRKPPFYENRLQLHLMRGLMAPCPNCGRIAWSEVRSFPGWIECQECGWRDDSRLYESACPCENCRDLWTRTWFDVEGKARVAEPEQAEDAPLSKVQLDAKPGLYRIVEGGSLSLKPMPVQRTQLNAYDVNRDRPVHHVVERQYARVVCAIRALQETYTRSVGFERQRQPNGNLILLAWRLEDCYEWQVERGERKEVQYTRNGDTGQVTLVTDPIVQGVKA